MSKKSTRLIGFDVDGTTMPQGGPIDPRVGRVFRGLQKLGIKVGPVTGKNADYARGLACGIGMVWDFVIAETGAVVLETVERNPPAYRVHEAVKGGARDLAIFARHIELSPIERIFYCRGQRQPCRPELKESVISLFPPGTDLEATVLWAEYFVDVISDCGFPLKVNRFSDGCVDVLPASLHKGLGIEAICKAFGMTIEEVLTAIDGVNDLELVIPGARVIAVANAVPEIKSATELNGGFIATHPDGMGFAQGLRYYAGEGAFGDISGYVVSLVVREFPELA